VTIETPAHGRVAVVLVGAANVGRISLAFSPLMTNTGGAAVHEIPPLPIPIRRGAELGAFNLGSTVVLLIADPRLAPAAGTAPGELVRMGQPLFGP
jgi:phosphatidylserine decarboxylase